MLLLMLFCALCVLESLQIVVASVEERVSTPPSMGSMGLSVLEGRVAVSLGLEWGDEAFPACLLENFSFEEELFARRRCQDEFS